MIGLFHLPQEAKSHALPTDSGLVTNAEGILAPGHDHSLDTLRKKYFYDENGRLDRQKLESLKTFLIEERRLVSQSAYLSKKTNLIDVHGYTDKKATKKGLEALGEEADLLGALGFALEHVEDLIKKGTVSPPKLTPIQIRDKVETTLLWFVAGYSVEPDGIWISIVKQAKKLRENFFDFDLDDQGALQASNLLVGSESNQRFASQRELSEMRLKGLDISKLNPPTSALWQNNRVEDYEPEDEFFFGQRMFPPRSEPLPVVEFDRMGNGQIKLKVKWTDTGDLGKKGKPKVKKLSLRVGWESYTESVVTHLARALGYHSIPAVFRPRVKMLLGDTTWEQFLSMYQSVHSDLMGAQMGSVITHLERVPGENAVIVKNATLEAYPDDDEYRKMFPFRMGTNGLPNRREYRAMVLYNALIMLKDHAEFQTRVDGFRDPKTGEWNPLYFISDTSRALGLLEYFGNQATVNEFTWKFTKRSSGKIWLFWYSFFDARSWGQTTISDLKWLARRMARLSSRQIDLIFSTSGFPAPAQMLYAEKIKSRINQLIIDLELDKEGVRLHPVLSLAEIRSRYPKYIDENGFLKEGAQEIEGNTAPILGNGFTPLQGVLVGAIKGFHSVFLKNFSPDLLPQKGQYTFDLGQARTSVGTSFGASRDISVNPEIGGNQKRYRLRDRFSVSLPIGIDTKRLKTPVTIYRTFRFEYIHSVSTIREVAEARFFDLLNPFSLFEIRNGLAIGEQLIVTDGWGASLGHTSVKAHENLQLEASMLGFSRSGSKSMYFSRTSEDMLEITTDANRSSSFKNGLDVKAIGRLGFFASDEAESSLYQLYRLDLLNETPKSRAAMESAFVSALVDGNFDKLNAIQKPRTIQNETLRSKFRFGLFVWQHDSYQAASEINLNGQKYVLAAASNSFDRAFDRLWTDKLDPKVAESPINYFGTFWNEGDLLDMSFEGTLSGDGTKFSESEVNISLSRIDNYASRVEYQKNFVQYFNLRSGQEKYIDFQMPADLEVYPGLVGKMRWQISHKALVDIMRAASDWRNLDFLDPKHDPQQSAVGERMGNGDIDPREAVSTRAARFLNGHDSERVLRMSPNLRKEVSQEMGRDVIFVIKTLIGEQGERLPLLRRWTKDENLWVLTSVSNMLDLSHTAFRVNQDSVYYAPEIGKFQGHSPMKQFYRNNLMSPVLGKPSK